MTGGFALEIAGEDALALPERALYLEASRTLLVADVHFGKAATFRADLVPIPRGTTSADLARLDRALARTQARRLIVLGDLIHAERGRAPRTLAALRAWRARHPRLEIVLVRGNHDHHAGDPPEGLGITCLDGPLREGPYAFRHEPEPLRGVYVIGGHIHPAVRLVGPARQRERLPCFLVGGRVAILPAFGTFTGTALVEPGRGDRVLVVAGDHVGPAGRVDT